MTEEFSKKPMSLNQLHNRFLNTSHSKSNSYGFHSEMKSRKWEEEDDGPSFNITDKQAGRERGYKTSQPSSLCSYRHDLKAGQTLVQVPNFCNLVAFPSVLPHQETHI